MNMNRTYQTIGKKRYAAAEFLIKLLSSGEKPSAEVYRLAEERGILAGTLRRAGQIIKAKSRKSGHNWFMSIPDDATERFESQITPRTGIRQAKRPEPRGTISSDWIVVTEVDGTAAKIEIPEYKASKPGLRVKVGVYEFEADEDFPAEKLAELLHKLNGESPC
jgi:hypothetical protein